MKDIIVLTQLIIIGLIPLATSFVMYIFNISLEDMSFGTFNSFGSVAAFFYVFILPLIVALGLLYIGTIYNQTGIVKPYFLIIIGLFFYAITFIPAYYYLSMYYRNTQSNISFSNAFISYPIHGIALIPYLYISYVLTNKIHSKTKVLQ